jgi:hypothetical protein
MLRRHDVTHFTSENENVKASIVERFNKTLRNVLHRFFTKTGRQRFVDALPDLVAGYNDRFHTAVGMTPNEVGLANQEDVWLRLYNPLRYFEKASPSLNVGDFVRISKARTAFQRGYTPNWSVELFIVDEVLSTSPTTYRIRDWNGEKIDGSFYEKELQKVREPKEYKIEKILARKKIGRRAMVLVKWEGYSDDFNQWIPESDVRDLT